MSKTPISALQEFAQKKIYPLPEYELVDQNAGTHKNIFTMQVTCVVDGNIYHANANSTTKKGAKHDAANKMIQILQEKGYSINCGNSSRSQHIFQPLPSRDKVHELKKIEISDNDNRISPTPYIINSVGKLQELCVQHQLKTPVYEDCPFSHGGFKMTCILGEMKTYAIALTKKQAKQDCAEDMRKRLLEKLGLSDSVNRENNDEQSSMPDLITLKLENLVLDTAPNVKASTEKARQFFPDLKKNVGVTNQDRQKISINTFHSIFKNSLDPKILQQYYSYFQTLKFDLINGTIEEYKKILHRICEILNVTFQRSILETKQLNKFAVTYALTTVPSYREIGIGDSVSDADLQAIKRIICAINLFLL